MTWNPCATYHFFNEFGAFDMLGHIAENKMA